ncbi:MAG: DNA alkylation repair protein [Rhodothermales bacterium]|nr:DNA alkylation repair protein [Rhodothermales bacterium]MCA0268174.1 DNA alkylation repair protein [Bacteroidota bacterium]
MTTASDLLAALHARANPKRADALQGFFQTGPGQYGEGDRFLGLRVPDVRAVAKEAKALTLADVEALLDSEWHEARLAALAVMVNRFPKAGQADREAMVALYLRRTDRINNWDLVDVSAPHIVGTYLLDRDDALDVLERLAASENLWERRIAAVATFAFIRQRDVVPTLVVAERLVNDRHDLIHKAVGWMLREAALRESAPVEAFLDRHAATMPRTMLRYTLERFPDPLRRRYMTMRVS